MTKILIIDAFEEITKQMESNNYDRANKMLEIVSSKVVSNNDQLTNDYISLSNMKEAALFTKKGL